MRRRRLALLGAFVVLVGAGFSIALVIAQNQKLVDLIGNTAAGVLVVVVLAAWTALKGTGSATADGPLATSAQAAEVLAKEARELYEQRQDARRLEERERPVPVTWSWFPHEVAGRPEDVIGAGAGVGLPLFEALPGTAAATPAMLADGGLNDLFKVYAGMGTGRVVVLGRAGAGKSAAAILTALNALRHRESLDEETRARVPVPVLLTPHDWNPKQQKLTDWLADRLTSDFTSFRRSPFGRWTPEQLIRDRRVALFLDGFEDLHTGDQRVEALRALKRLRIPLVLFSRSEEFTRAALQVGLPGAAVLELDPVPAGVAANCLTAWRPDGLPSALQRRLAEQVREEPRGVLARALSTPLMLTLLRDAFPDGDTEGFTALVDELLAPGVFQDPEDIHDRLLGRVLPSAYAQDRPDTPGLYTQEQAERWLGHIAARMTAKGTRQLAWWRVHEWASAFWRILAGVAGGALAAGLIAALVARFTDEFGERTVIGVLPATVAGGALGLATGIVTERRAARVVLLRGSGSSGFNAGRGLMSGLAVGAAVALTVGPAAGPVAVTIAAPVATLTAGIATGFAATGEGLTPPLATRRSRASPPARFLGRLIAGLPAGLATGAPAGLASAIPLGFAQGTRRGLVVGTAIGLAYTVAFGLIDGLARISPDADSPVGPMSAWNQDRKQSLSTGLVFGLAVGFAAGLTDALAMARHDPLGVAVPIGLITGVVIGMVTGVAAGLTVSHSWRTMVVFAQLWVQRALPLRAMRFLEDARQRQVLRETGPYYEFRHARLQDFLSRQQERNGRAGQRPEPDATPVRPTTTAG
ncbi:hypothetical protein ACFYPC_10820 [Streptomyces sp. NPDC005808]|uniref:hypothetical protein n=1 Tax=Streptomyces sp. NPDC005808 TaxID=3364734 RepID=UPI0036B00923